MKSKPWQLAVPVFWICASVHAAVSGITERAALGANDLIDWRQLGPAQTTVSTPAPLTSASGRLSVELVGAGGVRRLDQGSGWGGDFWPGEALVYTFVWSPIRLTFDQPLLGFGLQIQQSRLGAFTARLEAFDAAGSSLGVATRSGVSGSQAQGTAPFLGIWSSAGDIRSVVINSTDSIGFEGDFAVNAASVTVIPEPGGTVLLWLAALIFGGTGAWQRWRAIRRAGATKSASS